jgi:hypothetical protein
VTQCNTVWTVSYATGGPDTRTAQLFINYIDNSRLDLYGFAPFAIITDGFSTVLDIVNPTPGDSDGINQTAIYLEGNEYVYANYPNTSLITCASVIYSSNVGWGGGATGAVTCPKGSNDDGSSNSSNSNNNNKEDSTTIIIIAVMATLVFILLVTVALTKKGCCDKVFNKDGEESKQKLLEPTKSPTNL